ncbi:MAG: T9SS type A sorting domain-containing protein [Saprospiraceae bacterium]|nr:T9SS type A sorting domain-containing protein [Saprospiraceae bacterium]
MKKLFSLIVLICVSGLMSLSAQITIAQWNFNGESTTTIPGGVNSPSPVAGVGTASLIGGVTATFASGVASGGSSDTIIKTAPPNYAWNSTNYALSGTENKQRGVQFNVSTLGYSGITFKFDQRLSNSANNTYVVQYTVNGSDWIDAATFTVTPAATGTGDVWYNGRTVDLTGVTALNNNANAAFRIVSAFDPVTGNYLSATSTATYAVTGTSRYDMVTITGTSTSDVKFAESASKFIVFPNPASSVVNLSEPQNISVFDLKGKKVLTSSGEKSVNISSLKKGIYFVKTDSGEIRKLIVK